MEIINVLHEEVENLFFQSLFAKKRNFDKTFEYYNSALNILDDAKKIRKHIIMFFEYEILESTSKLPEHIYKEVLKYYDETNTANKEVVEKLIKHSKSGKFRSYKSANDILSIESLQDKLDKIYS